jgi:hypothetical protein
MKKEYIAPRIETTLLIMENELAAGFDPHSKGPKPPKFHAKESFAIEEVPTMAPSKDQMWEDEDN